MTEYICAPKRGPPPSLHSQLQFVAPPSTHLQKPRAIPNTPLSITHPQLISPESCQSSLLLSNTVCVGLLLFFHECFIEFIRETIWLWNLLLREVLFCFVFNKDFKFF